MANTFTLIEARTLSSSQTTVAFTSIPQTYSDLQMVFSLRNSTGADWAGNAYLTFNGATSRYYELLLYKAGTSLGSTAKNNADPYLNWAALSQGGGTSTWASGQFYIPNYTNSNAKSISTDYVSEDNSTSPWMMLNSGLWNPTTNAPITSMSFTANAGQFVANSTFYLYGIKNS
jgi:hypothetical protein